MAFSRFLIPVCFFSLLFTACEDYVPVPKPRAFPRVIYPEKAYEPFHQTDCNFTFEAPKYAVIERDTTFFGDKARSDCWFNIAVPQLNAKIYCSYYPITGRSRFDELVQDAFTMAQKHNIKASYIEEIPVHRDADRVHGIVFAIEGAAASSYQFFLTDSTDNFLRGALYFNTQTRPDSLAPVLAFMRQDVNRLVETLRWGK
jgi:gliding motility-associated lipoprotein GldD